MCFLAPTALAQHYPARPIRFIVPYPPGGGTDIVARIIAPKLGEWWGQQVVVDNRAGAGGNIGTEIAARATADGHTMLIIVSTFAINPSLFTKLPYDAVKNFAPVTQLTSAPYLLVVHPSVPARSVPELIALVRSKPGELNYASAGNGGPPHLAAELFKTSTGTDIVHVPYKGASPAVIDLLAGQVQLMFGSMLTTLSHVKSAKLRALAVTTSRRSAVLPELRTVAESGVPGYEVDGWYGIVVPHGTPAEIVNALSSAINKVLRIPELKERFSREGVEAVGSSPEQFAQYLTSELVKWAKVVKDSGARVD